MDIERRMRKYVKLSLKKKTDLNPTIESKYFFSGLGIVPFYLNLVLLKLGKHVERVIRES